MKNIKLIFSYDGSDFFGYQTQINKKTVQGSIEYAIKKVTGEDVKLMSAGRTDKGVHAESQVANFYTQSNIPGKSFMYHIRKYLPDSIIIKDSMEVDMDFHSRFSAKSKTYKYVIYNRKYMHPSLRNIYTQVIYDLDIEKMREASRFLIGSHDFKAFSKYENKPVNTNRSIDEITINRKDDLVIFTFKAESFLYNQVRIMVGSLVDVGRGHRPPKYIKEIIDSKDRLKAGMTFSSSGLYLMEITY